MELQRRTLVNALLSLPATLVWLPICGHYLLVFGVLTVVAVFVSPLPAGGYKPAVIAVAVSAWCVAGLVGIAALWSLILFRERFSAPGRLAIALRIGLWIGFAACVLALVLAGVILWRTGFNLFIHSLHITVLGPMAVFLRELGRLQARPGDIPAESLSE